MAYKGAGEANGLCPNCNVGELHKSLEIASSDDTFSAAAASLVPPLYAPQADSDVRLQGMTGGEAVPDGFEVTAPFTTQSSAVHHGLRRRTPSQRPPKRTVPHGNVSEAHMSPADVAAWQAHHAMQAPTATVRESTPAPRPHTSGKVGPTSGSHHTELGNSDQASLRDLSSASGASTAAGRGDVMKPPSSPGPCAAQKVAERVRRLADGSLEVLADSEGVRIVVVDGKTHVLSREVRW